MVLISGTPNSDWLSATPKPYCCNKAGDGIAEALFLLPCRRGRNYNEYTIKCIII